MPRPPRPFTDIDDAARLLGISPGWLRSEAVAGRIPSLAVGRKRVVHVGDLERLLRERAVCELPAVPA